MQKNNKVTMGYHFPPIRLTQIRVITPTTGRKQMRIHLCIVGRERDCYNILERNLALAIKLKDTHHFSLTIPLQRIELFFHRIEAGCMGRYILEYLLLSDKNRT